MARQPVWKILNIDTEGEITIAAGYPAPRRIFEGHLHVESVNHRLVVIGAHVHEDAKHQEDALRLYWRIARDNEIPLETGIYEMTITEFSARAFRCIKKTS